MGIRRQYLGDLQSQVMFWRKACFSFLLIPVGLLIFSFLTILDFPILLVLAHSRLHSSPIAKTDFNYTLESLSNVFSALPGSSGASLLACR